MLFQLPRKQSFLEKPFRFSLYGYKLLRPSPPPFGIWKSWIRTCEYMTKSTLTSLLQLIKLLNISYQKSLGVPRKVRGRSTAAMMGSHKQKETTFPTSSSMLLAARSMNTVDTPNNVAFTQNVTTYLKRRKDNSGLISYNSCFASKEQQIVF